MTREQAKKLLPIIQAYSEGKVIQQFVAVTRGSGWVDVDEPFFESGYGLRIKPAPREFWCNIQEGFPIQVFSTREEADARQVPGRSECIRLVEVVE